MVDRVVLHRKRTVSAAVLHFEAEIGVRLLAGLQAEVNALAIPDRAAARIDVDGIGGVDGGTLVSEQPPDAVMVAALLIRSESENQIAPRPPVLPFQPDH